MGIPKYFKYITSNFNDLTIDLDQVKVEIDHLYFDMNCLLHPCVRTVCKQNVGYLQEYLELLIQMLLSLLQLMDLLLTELTLLTRL